MRDFFFANKSSTYNSGKEVRVHWYCVPAIFFEEKKKKRKYNIACERLFLIGLEPLDE